MKSMNVYLTFAGQCEEALNFYKEALDGEIVSIQRFGDSPMEVEEEEKQRIMHSEFKADGVYFMASDGGPEHPIIPGTNVSLSLNFTDEQEQEVAFNKLASGGRITMTLQDTFWGAKFGMLTDKYEVNWMVNCQKSNS
jgi:PhnB protein